LFDFRDAEGDTWDVSENGDVGLINESGHFESLTTGLVRLSVGGVFRAAVSSGNDMEFAVYESAGTPENLKARLLTYRDIEDSNYKYWNIEHTLNFEVVSGEQYLVYLRVRANAANITDWLPYGGLRFSVEKI
jgi:hypothetical protein